MERYQTSESRIIQAPAARLYAIVADYRAGHPKILPKPYFQSLDVEEGGVGEGTRIRFTMRVMGRTMLFRAAVTEPEPGRVLAERNEGDGSLTTFTIDPLDGGGARVTIATEMSGRGGLMGRVERFLTGMVLRPIYRKELALLAALGEGLPDPR